MTVGMLLKNMTATEFAMWQAYARVENEKYSDKKDVEPTEEEQEVQQATFEANLKSSMERKGIRVRKKNVASQQS